MANKWITQLLLACWCLPAQAQQTHRHNWYLLIQGSWLTGDHQQSGAFAVASGISIRQWYVGGGMGVDYYKVRSIPLFAELRYNLTKQRSTSFVYLRPGYNFASALGYQHSISMDRSTWHKGGYAEGGMGYALLNMRGKGVSCSIGYSVKTLLEKYDYTIYTGPQQRLVPATRTLRYTFNRLAFSLTFLL